MTFSFGKICCIIMFIILAGLGIVTPGNVLALLEFSLEIGIESKVVFINFWYKSAKKEIKRER